MKVEYRKTPRHAPSSVLVYAPNWVGDHAMAFPFYAALRDLLPKAEIAIVGRTWVSDLAPENLGPIISFAGKNPARAILQSLREKKFALGFTLSPSFRSALLLYRIGAKRRYGFDSDLRRFLLTGEKNPHRHPPYNRYEHRSLAYLRLLNPLLPAGILSEDLWERYRDTKLSPLPAALLAKKFSLRLHRYLVVICPGSTAASKKYPIGHTIHMIESIARQMPRTEFVLLGAESDAADCDTIAHHFAATRIRVRSLCGKTSLREAHGIIAAAGVVVANDSGLAHITSLTPTPLVTFNGMGRRSETAPLTRQKILFDLELECSPCFAKICPRKDVPLACLVGIAPEAVAAAVLSYISNS